MGMRLAFEALDSHLFRDLPRLKIMLFSLCNYAGEQGNGHMWSSSMARHCGCGKEQVRRYKRKLEKHGLVTFFEERGKGRATKYQIHLTALYAAINETPGTGEYYPNQTPPGGGEPEGATPPEKPTTPPTGGQNPTSRGGPKREKGNKKARARGARVSDDGLTAGENALRDLLLIDPEFGPKWVESWCYQIIPASPGMPDTILVTTAFGKSRVKSKLESSSKFKTVRVQTTDEHEKALT